MNKRNLGSTLADAATLLLSLFWLVPLIFSILMSFRPQSEPITIGNIFFGSQITTANYDAALLVAPWVWHYITSVIFVVGVLAVQIITVTMAGYAFARMRFRGRNVLLFIILLQLMIPSGVLLVQNFATIRTLGLFDTRWALMLPYWGSAFGVLLMRQTFRGIPYELEEAARIDGANWLQIMRHVYIPLSIPAYVAFALVSISSHWNEFLWPFIVTRTEEVRPLTVGLNKLYGTTEVGALYGQLMAGTLLVIAPLVILFILFQRRFIESFATSGIK
ncbi:MAG: carbohydrate ABC transporter permease [Anaerolineaceae bacterium]|nr:carbohydrate ABC transporter permease [Anaerolineaceae bacterium]